MATRLASRDAVSHNNRARAYEKLGHKKLALRDYKKAHKLNLSLSYARDRIRRLPK